jgi:hypothetical protein
MNVSLDLSKAQLSKLRNGHGVRITPAVVGRGVELIIDPMTYKNMARKLEKGKGVIMKMGSNEIEMNKMEGTGLFDTIKSAYNKNVKNTAVGQAIRENARKGLNIGYDAGTKLLDSNKYTKPIATIGRNTKERNLNKAMQLSGLGLFDDIKSAYNKNVKNTSVGKAIRENARKGLNIGYDAGTKLLDSNKYTKPIATIGRNTKERNLNKAMQLSGLGLKLSGDGMRLSGNGLRMSGGMCEMCGCGAMQNDKFLFGHQAI